MQQFNVSTWVRRYLIRDADSREAIAVIEAASPAQAIERAGVVKEALALSTESAGFSTEEVSAPTSLPTFLEDFFLFIRDTIY